MGEMGPPTVRWRVRRYLHAPVIGMHVTLLVLLPAFAWLTWWQLGRALGGNTLSWAYTFEWPLFAGYAFYIWWQLIHDQAAGVPGRRPLPDGDDAGARRTGPRCQSALQPGWALTGGRRKNVAIAASSAVDEATGAGASGSRPRRPRRPPPWPGTTGTWPSSSADSGASSAGEPSRPESPTAAGAPIRPRAGRGGVVRGALTRYRVMAFIVGTALIILVFVAIPLQYWGNAQEGGRRSWPPSTATSTSSTWWPAADLARRAHWRLGRILLVVAAGFVPFLAFIVEHRVYQPDAGRVRRRGRRRRRARRRDGPRQRGPGRRAPPDGTPPSSGTPADIGVSGRPAAARRAGRRSPCRRRRW